MADAFLENLFSLKLGSVSACVRCCKTFVTGGLRCLRSRALLFGRGICSCVQRTP